jgi:membrane protein DedA with SNARE-associated domain
MEHVSLLISTYSFWILLPLMIIEGPIVTIIASFLASLGVLSVVYVYFLAVLGNVLGDLNYYAIGRFGRETFIRKYGKYIGLHEKNIEYIENHYKNHLLKTILIAKVTEAPIVPTLIAAGIAKTDIKKFLPLVTIIEIPKVLIIVLIGYYFGKFYVVIEQYFKDAVMAFGITFALLIIVVLVYKKLRAKKV